MVDANETTEVAFHKVIENVLDTYQISRILIVERKEGISRNDEKFSKLYQRFNNNLRARKLSIDDLMDIRNIILKIKDEIGEEMEKIDDRFILIYKFKLLLDTDIEKAKELLEDKKDE